jgi:hypothetical protein
LLGEGTSPKRYDRVSSSATGFAASTSAWVYGCPGALKRFSVGAVSTI